MEASSCKLTDTAEEHGSVDGAQSPAAARHKLPQSSAVAIWSSTTEGFLEQIKVGSFYEIDHSKLPSATPEQLKAIRIVMVSEMDEANVALRYPSVYSIRTHFQNGENVNGQKLPGLNEKYIMSSNIAGEVLHRRVPAAEIADRRNSWNFWSAPTENAERAISSVSGGEAINAVSKKGVCWSELKFTGMVQWGSRRQVQYIGRHEDKKFVALSKLTEHEDAKKLESLGGEEKKEDQKDGDELFKARNTYEEQNNFKRKRYCSRNGQKKRKNAIPESKNRALVIRKVGRKKELKKSIDRWSVERYKLAEENIYKIMKAKGAVFGNPILRPALRAEARKLIGDTGLLDHLLKHMAGKVAPGGADRFRRRHNADGAMEYWLESADLIDIRKEAGVQDTYWTPPPGWKLGDNPTRDPICAREIRELHSEITKIKKYMLEMASTKEQHLTVSTIPNSDISTMSLDHGKCSLVGLKEFYNEFLNRKARLEEQLLEISQSLRGMEEMAMILKSRVGEDENMSELEAPISPLPLPSTQSDPEREIKQEKEYTAAEAKAARIQRLKSGFRICKPQGTFLWPNMAAMSSPHSVVPTPPSASSATTTPPPLFLPCGGPHPPSSPLMKPLPRRPVSTINLNEAPPDHHTLLHSDLTTPFSADTPTNQRRSPNPTAYADLPRLVWVDKDHEKEGIERKEGSVGSSAGTSWRPTRDGRWLDLCSSSNSSAPDCC